MNCSPQPPARVHLPKDAASAADVASAQVTGWVGMSGLERCVQFVCCWSSGKVFAMRGSTGLESMHSNADTRALFINSATAIQEDPGRRPPAHPP